MASLIVKVVRIKIEPHENADALEIACVGDYQSIVRKGDFVSGELVAYIPEQSIVPEALLDGLGLRGKLAGANGDRVKAIRLRGVLSQGICYKAREGWVEGQDVREELGIVKYEPPVPTQMAGTVWAAGHDRCIRYDIENFKMYPDVIAPGEQVVFTEKLHGTWCQIGVVRPDLADATHGRLVASSKGMASQGLAMQPDAPENATNLYVRAARHSGLLEKLADSEVSVFVLGEVFGKGVQDLHYGASAGSDESLGFRVFDVYVGDPGAGRYLNDDELDAFCRTHALERVPVLYRGPFSREAMLEHTSGPETLSGKGAHIREGIVMRPVVERRHVELGRVQLKSVSEAYLLRKGATEYS
jgi:RNA ligase (TIGR02306 family)